MQISIVKALRNPGVKKKAAKYNFFLTESFMVESFLHTIQFAGNT